METADSRTQTLQFTDNTEDFYKNKIAFLQEQNEVLKCVIKDLKKNNDCEENAEVGEKKGECVECNTTKLEVRAINEKFETEIINLKKILLDERTQRAEEEVLIQDLEASMICLKDKLLSGLQHNSENCTGALKIFRVFVVLSEKN